MLYFPTDLASGNIELSQRYIKKLNCGHTLHKEKQQHSNAKCDHSQCKIRWTHGHCFEKQALGYSRTLVFNPIHAGGGGGGEDRIRLPKVFPL